MLGPYLKGPTVSPDKRFQGSSGPCGGERSRREQGTENQTSTTLGGSAGDDLTAPRNDGATALSRSVYPLSGHRRSDARRQRPWPGRGCRQAMRSGPCSRRLLSSRSLSNGTGLPVFRHGRCTITHLCPVLSTCRRRCGGSCPALLSVRASTRPAAVSADGFLPPTKHVAEDGTFSRRLSVDVEKYTHGRAHGSRPSWRRRSPALAVPPGPLPRVAITIVGDQGAGTPAL